MIYRTLENIIISLSKDYPVVTITGPRQAGKTTLAKMAFPNYSYCNLEHPEIRDIAKNDPKGFFNQFKAPLIIDEVQRVPELLSYIQVNVDNNRRNGEYILTGSHQLTLNASITQSLAGRTALISLLPFSLEELRNTEHSKKSRDFFIYNGFLPRIYDQNQNPTTAYRNYLHTYVERDVRQLINLKDLATFEKFLRLLAGRIGQPVNMSSLANDTGISATTISNWMSILEASYILFKLQPYSINVGKRIIKSPKIYFIETGLAAYLLGIENEQQVARDPLLGNLFENMVVVEALKAQTNKGCDPNLFYYRDSHNNEIDLLYINGRDIIPVEIKASSTYNENFKKGLLRYIAANNLINNGYVIYSGNLDFATTENIKIKPFVNTANIFEK